MNAIDKSLIEENEMDEYPGKVDMPAPELIGELASHYRKVLSLLGEDPQREGLLKTPERVAKALQFLTHGYELNPMEILRSAMFREDYKQMVIVKDIEI